MNRDEAIRARVEAATPGPWRIDKSEGRGMPHYDIRHEGVGWPICSMWGKAFRGEIVDADAEFIANARDDSAYMLDETARLRADLAAMTAERDALRERCEAAERDLREAACCVTCANRPDEYDAMYEGCDKCCEGLDGWKWRGPVAENKEGEHGQGEPAAPR